MKFELVDALRRLERLEPDLCHAVHPSALEWQLNAPGGVRLLELWRDDLAAPRHDVLASSLIAFLRARGVRLEIELPALGEGTTGEVCVTAASADGRLSVYARDLAHATLELTLGVLEGGIPTPPRPVARRDAARARSWFVNAWGWVTVFYDPPTDPEVERVVLEDEPDLVFVPPDTPVLPALQRLQARGKRVSWSEDHGLPYPEASDAGRAERATHDR